MADQVETSCSKCFSELDTEQYITCRMCKQKFHLHCEMIPRNVVEILDVIQRYFIWLCEMCKIWLCEMDFVSQNDMSKCIAVTSHSPNFPVQRRMAISSAPDPFLSDLSSSRKAPSRCFTRCKSPTYGGNTRVKIAHAEVVHLNYEKDYKHDSCDRFSEHHSEEHGESSKGNHLRKNESEENGKPITSSIDVLKCRLATTEANISAVLSDGEEIQYPIQDYFAELKVEEKYMLGLTSTKKRVIRINEIFHTTSGEGTRVKKAILITGDAGFGKTTLTKKLCYDWATLKPPNYISDFHLVVSIPLRKMGNEPIEEIILNEICSKRDSENQKDIIVKELNILVILDGFDEIVATPNLIGFLEDRRVAFKGSSANPTLILTSRPYAVEKICHLFDRRLSISGLSHESQNTHIQKILLKSKGENLIRDMTKNPFLRKVSECPLMLHLLCCIYGKDARSTISSQSELYLQVLKLLTLCYDRKNGKHFDKLITETSILENEIFISLGRIASESLLKHESITEISLKNQFQDEQELKFILGLGILVVVPTFRNMRVVMTYEFLHLTFAEFFASIYFFSIAVKPEPNLQLLSACIKRLKIGFVAGLLGERILESEIVRNWITEHSLTASDLHKIKNEARLNEDAWKIFCSYVKRIEYDIYIDDSLLLSPELTLPNLLEIKVKIVKPNEGSWNHLRKILSKFTSCNSLIIEVVVIIYCYSSREINHGVRFINMKGIMTGLMEIEQFVNSNKNGSIVDVHIHPKNAICNKESELFMMQETLDNELQYRGMKCVGIFPKEPISTQDSFQHFPSFTWKFCSMKILYNPEFDYGIMPVYDMLLPIIVVTVEEYLTICKQLLSREMNVDTYKCLVSFSTVEIPEITDREAVKWFFNSLMCH